MVLRAHPGSHRAGVASVATPAPRLGQHQGLRQLSRRRREVGRQWRGRRPLLLRLRRLVPLDRREVHAGQPSGTSGGRRVKRKIPIASFSRNLFFIFFYSFFLFFFLLDPFSDFQESFYVLFCFPENVFSFSLEIPFPIFLASCFVKYIFLLTVFSFFSVALPAYVFIFLSVVYFYAL